MMKLKQELITKIHKIMQEKKFNLAIAESATCGLLTSQFGKEPGISDIFLGSIIVYSPYAKNKLLKIKNKLINKFGTISYECAKEMVVNLKKIFKSNISISITGNAGPNTIENKELGLFYCGFFINDSLLIKKVQLDKNLNREQMQISICNYCLEFIFKKIK